MVLDGGIAIFDERGVTHPRGRREMRGFQDEIDDPRDPDVIKIIKAGCSGFIVGAGYARPLGRRSSAARTGAGA
jgi:hypothetical protein